MLSLNVVKLIVVLLNSVILSVVVPVPYPEGDDVIIGKHFVLNAPQPIE
jgi:hypothetical protein